MLLALWRWLWPKEAPTTRKRREEQFVTPEQLELALEEHMKEITFEWNEWYEKFDKLHLRLAKRAQRQKREAETPVHEEYEEPQGRPSVLHYPSPWRV